MINTYENREVQLQMQHQVCAVCDSDALQQRLVGRTKVLVCGQCSAVVTPLADNAAVEYYETDYSLTTTTRASTELHRYFRYPEYQQLVGHISSRVKPPAALLDVGCDHGFFLDDARRYGYRVTGVEPSGRGRRYAQSIGLQVHESINTLSDSFDVVTMWHVLEHIPDPRGFLSQLSRHMNAESVLFVRVPDFGHYVSKLFRDKWIWFQPQHHAVHYTKQTLRLVLERSGFTVDVVEQRRPNNRLTSKSYRQAIKVMHEAHGLPKPGLRGRLARYYQDITGVELFAIARFGGGQ